MKTNRLSFGPFLRRVLLALSLQCVLCVSAIGQIVVKGDSMTAVEAIRQIESNSDYRFFYNAEDLNGLPKKNIDCDGPIEDVLQRLFSGTEIRYRVSGHQIALQRTTAAKAQTPAAKTSAPGRTVSGTVVDGTTGEPVIGANVIVKGTQTGVATNAHGQFSISITGRNVTLEVSYLGYRTEPVYITDQGVVDVKLQPDDNVLSEVVVVGAGVQKKVSVTGSIASVKGLDLRAPSSSLTNNFAGKLAGVVSVVNSGQPGQASEFYIRGIGTFGGRTTPLILLDGVEISVGDLNNIPTESIDSFSILKDASATAIYGARGANGVMLVTTKDGDENSRARVNVTLEYTFQQPVNMVDFVDGATWMETYNEALLSRTPSALPKYSQEQIELTRSHKSPYLAPDVDWRNLLFKDMTMSQRGNISISGGGSRVTYYLSLQANHNTGMLDIPQVHSFDNNINNWDYIFQNNITYKLTRTTKVELRMNAQIGRYKGPGYSVSDLFKYTYYANPVSFPATYPAQEGDDHVRYGSAWLTTGETKLINPYAEMMKSFKEEEYSTLNTTLRINQQFDFITKGLSLTALVNFKDYGRSYYTRSIDPFYYQAASSSTEDNLVLERVGSGGSTYITDSGVTRARDNTLYIDARIDYQRTFAERHHVSGMLMYMQREYRNNIYPNRNQGFSGRFTYDYDHRYLIEANFGYNGTERLAKEDRFEFFPAMSLGWVVSGEKFWQPVKKYINYLKLRGSYGLVGSDETGTNAGAPHFLYLDNVNLTGGVGWGTGYNAGSDRWLQGPLVNSYAVQNACWERVKKLDVGVDLNLFNQLDLTVDYFYDKRDRILMKRASWPEIMGYRKAVPWSNIGKVDNWGWEVSLNWHKQISRDMFIDLRGNFTYNQNKYVYVDEPNYYYTWKTDTGRSLNVTKGYIAEGLFADQDEIDAAPLQNLGSVVMPGDIRYRDVNGDGMITEDDMVTISDYSRIPRIQYGFGFNFTWKSLDFGVFFTGSAQRTIMLSGMSPFFSDTKYGDRNLMTFIARDYWSESNPNPNAAYPRLGISSTQIDNNTKPSTYWMRSGNFLRFKTLEIGYRFPYCRVYLSADNLAVWSPFKHWDPELNYDAYPLSRTFNIGVQLNF